MQCLVSAPFFTISHHFYRATHRQRECICQNVFVLHLDLLKTQQPLLRLLLFSYDWTIDEFNFVKKTSISFSEPKTHWHGLF